MPTLLATRWRLFAAFTVTALLIAFVVVSSPEPMGVSANPIGGIASVSAGNQHTCAVSDAGLVECWGDNTFGQLGSGSASSASPVQIVGLTNVAKVAAGGEHTCALTSSGGVKCWGQNRSGQLGDGGVSSGSTPVDVVGLSSGVVALATGSDHTCAVTSTGSVKCWGNNSLGQLGSSSNEVCSEPPNDFPCRRTPADVDGLGSGATDVGAGFWFSCAAMNTGGVKCWGYNTAGQLGNGTFQNQNGPVDVVGLAGPVATVSTGFAHTCIVTTSGDTQCWGGNYVGQLGDGTQLNKAQPVAVVALPSDTSIVETGYDHTCALLVTGGMMCWGLGVLGQLGTDLINSNSPLTVGIGSVIALSGGGQHTCAATVDGSLFCWGHNRQGQLGDGTGLRFSAWPVAVLPLGTSSAQIAAGLGSFNCVVTTTASAKCWGSGQLGDGSTTLTTKPVQVFGLGSNVAALSVGDGYVCAVTTLGGIKCWGGNSFGQLGDGTQLSRLTPIDVTGQTTGIADVTAGRSHTCALTTTGGVRCWGWNPNGQLGDGTQTDQFTAMDVSGPGGATAVRVGGQHTCAITGSAGVQCWGSDGNGQLGAVTTEDCDPHPIHVSPCSTVPLDVIGLTSGVAAISTGDSSTCVLTTTGGVKCWGSIASSSVPADVVGLSSGVTALSLKHQHACALLTTGAVKCWGANSSGQLGDGSRDHRTLPVNVAALDGSQAAISTGGQQTCAISVSGEVSCWGRQVGLSTIFSSSSPVTVVDASPKPTPTFTPCPAEGCPTATATPPPTGTPASGPPSEMLLNIKGGNCDDSDRPTACDVPTGEEFLLSVDAVVVPSSGYILAQTYVDFGENLTYKPSEAAVQEILWPDCQSITAVRHQLDATLPSSPGSLINSDEVVGHGCLTGLLQPIPPSHYSGNLVEFTLSCSDNVTSTNVQLLPYADDFTTVASSSGALFVVPIGSQIVPLVSNLTINCVDAAPAAVGGVALGAELRGIAAQDGPAPWLWAALGFGLIVTLSALGSARRRRAVSG
ncbi:MAG: hypothetical protein J4N98_02290 [Chloroflexi bacterium]|nr:hypothetical protein [Chloroflexota bacterium]